MPRSASFRDEREQHPDAEVEPFEQEVHGPDDGVGQNQKVSEIHAWSAGSANSSPSPPTSGRVDTRVPAHEDDVHDQGRRVEDDERAETGGDRGRRDAG